MDTMKAVEGQEFTFLAVPELTAAPGEGLRRFRGVAYGGGVITDHSMWDRVAFDLGSVKAADRMPVLLDHDPGQIVGFTGSVKIGSRIEVEGFVAEGEPGRRVASLADQGFPWQMSVRIMPETVVRLDLGETMKVNGRRVEGPAAVFKDSLIREVSFCALGADRETEADVFNMKEALPMESMRPGQDRDLAIQALNDEKNQFRSENDSLKSRQAEFAAENAELKGQVKALEFERRALAESLGAAREEAEGIRQKYEALRRSSREAVLSEDFRRLGLAFSAEDENIMAVVRAEDAVFDSFRKALGEVKPVAVPPRGAFENVTEPVFEAGAGMKTLAQRADEMREKEERNGN
ncbi:MAG: hypothetical protein LBQ79_07945 [Deltaproteobacteria bacterium]|jgi:hypothetical protein|nr:hypothetical protein [Deltaproteobacteria bacterium]